MIHLIEHVFPFSLRQDKCGEVGSVGAWQASVLSLCKLNNNYKF